jgi:hypothetical protein
MLTPLLHSVFGASTTQIKLPAILSLNLLAICSHLLKSNELPQFLNLQRRPRKNRTPPKLDCLLQPAQLPKSRNPPSPPMKCSTTCQTTSISPTCPAKLGLGYLTFMLRYLHA